MKRCHAEEGQALVLALFVLFLLGISLALLAQSLDLRLQEQRREVARIRIDQMVDGVVAETLARLARSERFSGVRAKRLGAGEVASRVEEVASGEVRIEASASLGGRYGRAVVRAELTAAGPVVTSWRRGAPASQAQAPGVHVE